MLRVNNLIGFGGATKAVTPTLSDPHFANVTLLTSFDGTDGATSATDDSNSGHTLTFNGNAQIDTAQKKFGTASLLSDGSADYVSVAASTDFDVGSGDFTIECFPHVNTKKNCALLSRSASGTSRIVVWMTSGGIIQLFHNAATIFTGTVDISTLTFPHVAICRASGTTRLFINGVMDAKTTTGFTVATPGQALVIGSDPADLTGRSFNGWIDEMRFTKGVGRYASDTSFTPPAAAFPRS